MTRKDRAGQGDSVQLAGLGLSAGSELCGGLWLFGTGPQVMLGSGSTGLMAELEEGGGLNTRNLFSHSLEARNPRSMS